MSRARRTDAPPVLALLGMAGGAALLVVGSSQLSAAWLSPASAMPDKERATVAWVAVGLVGLGTVLEALSTYELQRQMAGRRS